MLFLLNVLYLIIGIFYIQMMRKIVTNRLPKLVAAELSTWIGPSNPGWDWVRKDLNYFGNFLSYLLLCYFPMMGFFILTGLIGKVSPDFLNFAPAMAIFTICTLVGLFSIPLAILSIIAPRPIMNFSNRLKLTNISQETIDRLYAKKDQTAS